jgi:DNA-binding HxlR family transcriptional regulator
MPVTSSTTTWGCPVSAFQKMINGKYKIRIMWT